MPKLHLGEELHEPESLRAPGTSTSLDGQSRALPAARRGGVDRLVARGDRGTIAPLLFALQRSVGNRVVQRMVRSTVQRQASDDDAVPVDEATEISGGHYSPTEKKRAAEDPGGLILTIQQFGVGRQEAKVRSETPAPLKVSKKWSEFEHGEIGRFVDQYNDFGLLFGEILTSIGRLRDLLSAGAPESPEDMSQLQQQALRPTDDSPDTAARKKTYLDWRNSQQAYAKDGGDTGKPTGLAFKALETGRQFRRAREDYWHAQEELQNAVARGKATASDKPTYEAIEVSLGDIVSLAQAIPEALAKGPVALAGPVATGIDKVRGAATSGADFEKKLAKFNVALRGASNEAKTAFGVFRTAVKKYHAAAEAHATMKQERDAARGIARQNAGVFGQITGRAGQKPAAEAQVRMGPMVADALRALAVIGPPTRASLDKAMTYEAVIERASNHDLSWRGNDPMRQADISQIRDALYTLRRWQPRLADAEIAEWQMMSGQWEEILAKINR